MSRSGLDSVRFLYARARNLKSLALNIISNPVVVLCYHRVARLQSDLNALAVTPENFRAHLEYLKKNFPVVRFEEDWQSVKKPSIVITFDDGYADNLEVALPIIEEAGVPVTFFVSTAAIDSGDEFWWDALERLVLGDSGYPGEFTVHDPRGKTTWSSATLAEREALFREVHTLLLDASAEQRTNWLQQVRAWAGKGRGDAGKNRPLTPEELQLLAASRWVTIGAHTVTHPRLATLDETGQRAEIAEAKHYLENLLGKKVTVFSYPFGRKRDYNPTSVAACREAGFTKAAAAFPGEVYPWTDPYQLPRHFIYNWDGATLAGFLRKRWIG